MVVTHARHLHDIVTQKDPAIGRQIHSLDPIDCQPGGEGRVGPTGLAGDDLDGRAEHQPHGIGNLDGIGPGLSLDRGRHCQGGVGGVSNIAVPYPPLIAQGRVARGLDLQSGGCSNRHQGHARHLSHLGRPEHREPVALAGEHVHPVGHRACVTTRVAQLGVGQREGGVGCPGDGHPIVLPLDAIRQGAPETGREGHIATHHHRHVAGVVANPQTRHCADIQQSRRTGHLPETVTNSH
jgi:hypothetical protein